MTDPPIASADDLRARIRGIAVTEPNPARITELILQRLTGPEYQVVAAAALHDFVARVLHVGLGGAVPVPVQAHDTPTGRTPSAKVAAIRDWVARELLKPICIEPGERWVHLRDCTAQDLAKAVDNRRRTAAATLAEADHLEGIQKATEHAGVGTVGELPRGTLEAVLKR